MRGLVFAMVLLGLGGVADAKPCPKGTSRIGKKCVIDRWGATPRSAKKLPPPTITLAVLHAPDPASQATLVDKTLPVEATPTAAAIYHAAQAYRRVGDRTKALELYDRYLLVAPAGPAAPAVRAQVEKLRTDVPQ